MQVLQATGGEVVKAGSFYICQEGIPPSLGLDVCGSILDQEEIGGGGGGEGGYWTVKSRPKFPRLQKIKQHNAAQERGAPL